MGVRTSGFTFAHSLALVFAALGITLYVLSGAPERALAARERAFGGIREGDLVFQDLACGQRCSFIRRVTESRYVHVGLVMIEDGERVVCVEALASDLAGARRAVARVAGGAFGPGAAVEIRELTATPLAHPGGALRYVAYAMVAQVSGSGAGDAAG